MKEIGIYLHYPFCMKKCNYCDFYTLKYNYDNLQKYNDKMMAHLIYWSKQLKYKVNTIYFGGGTPSLLSEKNLSDILDCINLNFSVTSDCEITLEANPENITKDYAEGLYNLGINRVSMGAQSLNQNTLDYMGRSHNVNHIKNAVNHLHSFNISNISLDFIIGMQSDDKQIILKNIDFLKVFEVPHTSFYMLKIEKGTDFYKNTYLYNFLNDDDLANLYQFMVENLHKHCFNQYEISNFSKSIDTQSKHNKKYWTLSDFLGIGPSSYSLINKQRFFYKKNFFNFLNEDLYYKIVEKEDIINKKDYIIFGLRLKEGVALSLINEVNKNFHNKLSVLLKNGLCEINRQNLCLTTRGFLVSNSIIKFIIE